VCFANKAPDTVKSLDDVLSTTLQTSLTVVGIFVGVEFPLLFFFKNDSNFPRSGSATKQVFLASAYCGLFFTLSAAVTGLILSKLRKTLAQTSQESDWETTDSSRGHRCRALLTWVTWHWIISLIGGITLPIAQVLLFVWFEESNAVRISLSIITVFAALPLVTVSLTPLPSGSDRRHSIIHT